ncbi:MAG: PKD domain-containing protein [Kiritimatiellae bacterium]|nr:PKD domain-containing protein [Kiritimatiellia bacterium]
MKTFVSLIFTFCFVTCIMHCAIGSMYYVDDSKPNDSGDGTSWGTAKKTIQAAVDVTVDGDTIQVTDGTYPLTSEILVATDIVIESINGPGVTVVDGQDGVRVFNLEDSFCMLSGFMITNGYTTIGGGGISCVNTNPVISDCVISGCYGGYGGGSYYGTLNNCTISGNASSRLGGGSYSGTLNNCIISDNATNNDGGGSYGGALNNCIISGNTAHYKGGGTYGGLQNNCAIFGNTADSYGGGSYQGTLNNCAIFGNTANRNGGGSYYGTLNNCTIIGNTSSEGGGSWISTLRNSIVYYNEAKYSPNYYSGNFYSSCTTPLPSGSGNFDDPPQIAGTNNWHLLLDSPCVNAGSMEYLNGTLDFYGEPRTNGVVDVGCDELWADGLTGDLEMAIDMPCGTNGVMGIPIEFRVMIFGQPSMYFLDFDDGTATTNLCFVSHVFTNPGSYTVTLTASNSTGMVSTDIVVIVDDGCRYVSTDGDDANSGLSWTEAKATIQAGVDSAINGCVVWVDDGIYSLSSQVTLVTDGITVSSANGPEKTVIDCGRVCRGFCLECPEDCFFAISGFTITNGYTTSGGGGVYCVNMNPVISDCVISGCYSGYGGGACYGTLNNCTISGNVSGGRGGGSCYATLNNCTISGNTANSEGGGSCNGTLNNCAISGNTANSYGGGSYYGTLNNCTIIGNKSSKGGGSCGGTLKNSIVYYNMAPSNPNFYNGSFYYSCSTPLPSGSGNFNAPPQFEGTSNWHLLPGSPCVDAGSMEYLQGALDLDGEPRANGVADVGCDELWYSFDHWMGINGLTGFPEDVFVEDRNDDGIINGFDYVFGDNLSSGEKMLDIDMVNKIPVVIVPVQDAATIPYVDVNVLGSTNLTDWNLSVIPMLDPVGKPANRSWLQTEDEYDKAFFKLKAILK